MNTLGLAPVALKVFCIATLQLAFFAPNKDYGRGNKVGVFLLEQSVFHILLAELKYLVVGVSQNE
jgi:hypothetical protein